MNNARTRNILIYLLVIVAIGVLFFGIVGNSGAEEVALTELVNDINADRVEEIEVREDRLTVTYKNDEVRRAVINATAQDIPEVLRSHGAAPERVGGIIDGQETVGSVTFKYERPSSLFGVVGILTALLPLILIAGFIYFMVRQAQGSNNQAMQFGRSRARMLTGDHPTVTFEDVAGADESKEELKEVVEFLKEPDKFIQLGARIPKGVLLVGSPGTGKTLLAKAVAGEAGVPFFSISGSEFVEMFVGVGASRVRDLFEQAKRHSPCIIFVDEIDAVGRQRGSGLGGSHDEREQTLNQILVEMDGFDTDTNVIVVAATNRPDILDPALLRPGRFDRRVILDRPDVRGREAILKVHTRGKPLSSDVNIEVLAKTTPGFVGADLENLVNEAAIVAARKNRKTISMRDFEEATERVALGPERKSRVIPEDERRTVAYHEAGHAVAMHKLPNADKVRKITIVPRGMAGGVTWSMPANDNNLGTIEKFYDMICGLFGGRAAEELAVGTITNGAANDLERVTQLARTMITRWGMSDRLGLRVFGRKDEMIFLGREIAEERDYSERIAELIDEEVQRIVEEQYQRALAILRTNRESLDIVAKRLLEVETLGRNDFLILMGDEPEEQDVRPAVPDFPDVLPPKGDVRGNTDMPPSPLPPAPSPA
ncbi:MAG: ATP-dependent metallopeptidase FtsH/Yme1/Tma family protein [Anaerolineae bacterium]|nr:ATP-dependent metallopeptidase FtsH/Yme1/Tma family protein [Anaerolineae bacterium]